MIRDAYGLGWTHVAPARNISTVFALTTADSAVISSIVVFAMIITRLKMLVTPMHM